MPRTPYVSAIDISKPVKVLNRTADTLTVECDGRIFILEPGWGELPAVVVPYAFRQHPRLGTFDEHGIGETLIAVPGVTPAAQCRMIQPGQEQLGIELIDRNRKPLPQAIADAEGHLRPAQSYFEPLPAPRTVVERQPLEKEGAVEPGTGRLIPDSVLLGPGVD
jgi:hypothetical protein